MMKHLWAVIAVLGGVGAVVDSLGVAAVAASPVVRVGVYENPPKVFLDAEGQPEGFFPDLLTAIAAAEDWQLDYVPCPWQQCLEAVEAGQLDLLVDVASSPERQQRLAFNQEVVLSSWSAVYVPQGMTLTSILDLDRQRIAVLRGSIQQAALLQQRQTFNLRFQVVPVDDMETVLELLDRRQVDAGVVNRFFGEQRAGAYRVARTDVLIEASQLHFAAPKGRSQSLLTAIDRQLRAMKRQPDSAYYQALKRWLATPRSDYVSRFEILLAIATTGTVAMVIITVGALAWNHRLQREVQERQRMAAALQQIEQRFQLFADNSQAVLWIFDPADRRQIYVSPAYEQIWGRSRESLFDEHASLLESVYSEDRSSLMEILTATYGGSSHDCEYRIVRPDGEIRWIHDRSFPLEDSAQRIHWIGGIAEDITARKQAEQTLQESELLFRSLFEQARIGIAFCDVAGHLVRVNAKYCEITGYPAEELQGKHFLELTEPEVRDRNLQLFQQTVEGEINDFTLEKRYIRRDGSLVWVEVAGAILRDPAGEATAIIALVDDISSRKRAEADLQTSEQFLRSIYDYAEQGIFIIDVTPEQEFRLVALNPSQERATGLTTEAVRGQPLTAIFPPAAAAAVCQRYRQCLEAGQPITYEEYLPFQHQDHWWLTTLSPVRNEAGAIVRIIGTTANITERKRIEDALLASETRLRNMAANIPGALFQYVLRSDGSDGVLYMSPGCYQLWEITPAAAEANARLLWEMVHPEDIAAMQSSVLESARTLQPWRHDWRIVTPSGVEKWLQAAGRPERQANGDVIWDTVILDISDRQRSEAERQRAEAQLAYYALHDVLTDLPNRKLLMQRLDLAIQRQQRWPDHHYALLFLDLDRFKVINDSLGHQVGDQLLVTVARKLESLIRTTDLAARLGGDEFVVLLEDIEGLNDAIHIARRIIDNFQERLLLGGREVAVTTSIGIVIGGKPGWSATDLLRNADIAMYRAKAQGRDRYEIFDLDMHTQAVQRLTLENDLRRALERQEFVLYYQPLVALATGQLIGFEALVRWQHPRQGLVPPGQFIGVAEETGLIVPLSHWLLESACQQLARWCQQCPHLPSLAVSINLSARNLTDPELPSRVEWGIAQLPPGRAQLTLEITESMLIQHIDTTTRLLDQFRASGARISIDDFGTGYSSLSYLHRLPADSLKIDASFVRQMERDERNQKIVETIVTLSDQLGLQAIAEGIETLPQLEQLRQLGCEYGQGYLLAAPLPVAAATELLLTQAQASLIKV